MHNFEAEQLFLNADKILKEGRYGEAATAFTQLIERFPDFGKAYNHLGWLYETKFSDLLKGEECYRLAVKHAPNYRSVYYNYAVVLATLKRYDDLDQLLKQALDVPGIDRGRIYNEYAIMYETQGQFDKAIEHYKKYMMALYNEKTMDAVVRAIDRCKRKKTIFSGYSSDDEGGNGRW